MKSFIEFVKTTLLGGLLVVLPVWLSVLLLAKSIGVLTRIFQPITHGLPENARHPVVLSVLALLFGCFAIGLLVRTSVGRLSQRALQVHLLDRIPGYGVIRGMTLQLAHQDHAEVFTPCLAEIEEALVPAFIVERHADGRMTVFVPSVPTPVAGSIYILSSERVHAVDVPLLKMISCVSKWGSGSSELLVAMQKGSLQAAGSHFPEASSGG